MTDYQKAVAEHMATAPQELAEYVRGRLVSSDDWREGYKPIQCCGFDWHASVEGYSFWIHVDMKNWPKAMATDFWRSRTASSEATSIEFGNTGQPLEEIAAQVAKREEQGFEAICTGGAASSKEVHGLLNFEKPEHPEEYDFVNPKHYQEFSVEVIDMMAAIWGKEATALHCEMCAFKYKLRAGSKPDQPIQRDLEKAAWYLSKAKELRDA